MSLPPFSPAQAERRSVVTDITGVVQGVGFRPAVHGLAVAAGLGGWVQNRSSSVRLALIGPAERIRSFLSALPSRLPPHARIDTMAEIENRPLPADEPIPPFTIRTSEKDPAAQVSIPADLAICPDCTRELFDPSNRRFGHPFITCTRCGPRYTVIHGMPYDRIRTTLSVFPLCPDCAREYADPGDRRFHAESIACPACGPRLFLEDARGRSVSGNPLRAVRAALASGAIVAVRGLGGYLLAADATNRQTLAELRRRKNRPHKPFAVQARALDCIEQQCVCEPAVRSLLQSPEAPIVILETRDAGATPLPMDLLSPDTQTLGVMLPVTPLQALLAAPLPGDPTPPLDWLVMTSGNRGGEPICISQAEARARLAGIADLFLFHDREINLRCDDSLCVVRRGAPQVWRRARGYAPNPILLRQDAPDRPQDPFRLRRTVLAMGAEMKNAIALGWEDRIVASPHIGDLESPEAVDSLRQVSESLPRFLDRPPEIVAIDAHPDMHASRVGREIAGRLGIPVREVQHHHAHAAACLAEHGRREGLALVFDGAGLGPDGHIWGAELLALKDGTCRRLASFSGVPLPGGDAAVRHPVRQLAGRCVAAGIDLPPAWRNPLGIREEEWQVWMRQSVSAMLAPTTHAAGRLFDSFAAALGFANATATYEGQTAIRLEAAARRYRGTLPLPAVRWRSVPKGEMLWVDWADAFRDLFSRPVPDSETSVAWAYAVHVAIADAACEMVKGGVAHTRRSEVALSGGVFMNGILTDLLAARLEALGIGALLHRNTPPNDGCIAIGQAVVAGGE
jgi:hydrogenase maturation protein HypF